MIIRTQRGESYPLVLPVPDADEPHNYGSGLTVTAEAYYSDDGGATPGPR